MDHNAVENERAVRRAQIAPELAKQIRNRSRKKADGDIHAIDRRQAASRKQEAAEVHEVDRGPVRRWAPSSALPAMPELPGFHIEYVRRDDQQRDDHANLVKHLQEQWDFCRKSDFPRIAVPTLRLTDYGEVIGNASSILMKIPLEIKGQRDSHYQKRRNATTRAINQPNGAGGEAYHPAMPIVEDVNRVQSVRVREKARRAPVKVQDD